MKKNTNLTNLYIPVSLVLLLATGTCKGHTQNIMAALLAAWTILIVLSSFWGSGLHAKTEPVQKADSPFFFRRKRDQKPDRNPVQPDSRTSKPDSTPSAKPGEGTGTLDSRMETLNETELSQLMQHISLRISDKLKSAYPDAIWQWTKEPSLKSILSGATVRISVERMEKYTHADISFDRFGRIHIEPMAIGSFGAAGDDRSDGSDPEEDDDDKKPSEPSVTDPAVWYQLIGQKILDKQISSLNAKGHTKLTINEKGDILIRKEKSDVILTTMEAFPAKNYWSDLISLLSEDELNAKITGDRLQISWI